MDLPGLCGAAKCGFEEYPPLIGQRMRDYFSLQILSDISSLYFTFQNFLAILHLTTICLNNTMSDSTQRNPSKK